MDPTTSQQPDPSRDAGAGGAVPAPAESVDRGYEPMLMSGRAVGWFVLWFVGVAAVINVVLWVLLKHYDREFRRADEPANVIADTGAVPRGEQGPPLQPSTAHDALPREDLAAMRQAEDDVFTRLGWVDQTTRAVRVPDAVVSAVAKRAGGGASTGPTTSSAGQSKREGK